MILTNAQIVTPHRHFRGAVEIRNGLIANAGPGPLADPAAENLGGDYLLPGLIDLHTDALLAHQTPRPGVKWPIAAALAAHDAQMAASGVTTVFDALPIGSAGAEEPAVRERIRAAIAELEIQHQRGLRAHHLLHLRVEVSFPDTAAVFPEFADTPLTRLVSLMDHTPGQGQYGDMDRWRAGFRMGVRTPDELEARLALKLEHHNLYAAPHRKSIAAMVAQCGLPLASHDDRTLQDVQTAAEAGVTISEFPVTLAAAQEAKRLGLSILMGGPNLVLGGSHSGNVAARDVASRGWLDGLTSDYVPLSLLHAVFHLADAEAFPLEAAIALVTAEPARMAGLSDRGAIAPGLRADLVQVRYQDRIPRVIRVWRQGVRIV